MEMNLTIRHTANAGVLINIGRNSLGVDLFSRDPEGLYPDTPAQLKAELLDEIERGHIEALLFTHGHGDHFCPEDAAEALKRNPNLAVISTDEVIGLLRAAAPLGKRLYAVSSKEKGNVRIQFPEGSLELFNSRHMGEAYAGVQNLVFMLNVNGKQIVIPGDAWPDPELFARIGAWSPKPEVFIAPFPLIGLPSNRKMIKKYLKPVHILALHLPRPEMDEQNWAASAKSVCERTEDGLPMPDFGEILGKEYHY
ncbi:MAG: MBL fold metallo-hydrolase [Lachnospiraceae bacterium]|jgi:L-ascorbate metabolism protein UlaG (beta-lactamase superfamily)|nr:MBL fold metallo-hydrolase [Lachnospiraceae bacterium]